MYYVMQLFFIWCSMNSYIRNNSKMKKKLIYILLSNSCYYNKIVKLYGT